MRVLSPVVELRDQVLGRRAAVNCSLCVITHVLQGKKPRPRVN